MKRVYIKVSLAILFFFFSTLMVAQAEEIVAYFIEWGVYNQPAYYVKNIETSGAAGKITVLNYAFAIPAPDETGDIVVQLDDPYAAYQQIYTGGTDGMSIDGVADAPGQALMGHFNQLRKLKLDHPNLKILISIGGWTGSTYFSDAALTPESRQRFVESCIDMFINGNLPEENGVGGSGVAAGIFDGIDIDWEYPVTGGDAGIHHNSNDDVNLSLLLAEFRKQLGPDLLLTAATPASDFRAQNFRINHDQQYVDWFLLMSYDFHGTWERSTGHLTNLLTSPDDPSSDAFKLSMDSTVRLYHDTYSVSPEKLIPGAAFYGRGWKGVSSTNDGLYQSGRPASGKYEDGYNYYVDLVPLLGQGYTTFWDDKAMAAWLYSSSDKIFWTLDEPQSLALKKRYVDAYKLGGIMFWEISGDDSQGTLINSVATANPPGGSTCDEPTQGNININITNPDDCGISFEGFNVIINADVIDPDGKVKQVEFFVDSESLGYDTQAPYSWAWFNVPPGTFFLTAVATDNECRQTTSEPIIVTVKNASTGLTLWQTGVMYQTADLVFYEGCVYECKKPHMGSRVRIPSPSSKYWQLSTCSDCGGPTPSCGDGNCDLGEDECNETGGYVCEDCGTPPSTETDCTDSADNDCDGNTDCDDADCNTDSACSCTAKGESCNTNDECCTGRCKNGKCR
jgi:GH18 family chitinase